MRDAESPKQRLLDALVAHFTEHRLLDASLREMARAVGTSHRMLAYHFGSRQGVLIEVSREVERQQRQAFVAMLDDPSNDPVAIMRTMYSQLADPSLRGPERLFFELYAHALTHPEDSAFLPEVVEAWLEPLTKLFAQLGFAREDALAEARLSLATSRGLLLDLLATGDREAIDAAMERYLSRYASPG